MKQQEDWNYANNNTFQHLIDKKMINLGKARWNYIITVWVNYCPNHST